MEFQTTPAAIVPALERTAAICNPKNPIEVAQHVRIAVGGMVEVMATDNHQWLVEQVADATIANQGSICVPGKQIAACLRLLPSALPLTFRLVKGELVVTGGGHRFEIASFEVSDYPTPPTPDGTALKVPGLSLARLIELGGFAAAKATLNMDLAGALLETRGSSLAVTSTDKFHFAHAELAGVVPQGVRFRQMLDGKAVDGLRANVALAGADPVQFSVTPVRAFAQAGARCFSGSLMSSNFPEYETYLPPRTDLLAALGQCQNFVSWESTMMALELEAETVRLRAGAKEKGRAEVVVPITANNLETGLGTTFTFPPELLATPLRLLPHDDVTISFPQEPRYNCLVLRTQVDEFKFYHLVISA